MLFAGKNFAGCCSPTHLTLGPDSGEPVSTFSGSHLRVNVSSGFYLGT
jgi:hypothetical protein